jgi:N6-L-threonylcarbamoyladenine synthase
LRSYDIVSSPCIFLTHHTLKVLAIESSCDETSAAVVCDSANVEDRIMSNIVNSQTEIHAKYGGVVPEFAARSHLDAIDSVINEALAQANVQLNEIDVIATTAGPGLIGGLLVGMVTAKTIAMYSKKPFIAINHLEGHLLTVRLCKDGISFPYLLLLTSGGHFFFAEVMGVGQYEILGETLDDAAGESFDKVAKILGLPYPGGPAIEDAAKRGDPDRFKYTIPLQRRGGCDASFSGLKTATRLHFESLANPSDQDRLDIAASFQRTVIKFIVKRLENAYNMSTQSARTVVVAGGVASNMSLRNEISRFCEERGLNFEAPPIRLCSDNAAMIGWAAIERIKAGFAYSDLKARARPRWPITEI